MGAHHSSTGVRPDSAGAKEGKIRVAHLLVKHSGSRRPSSWKEPNITRSKEEAMDIIKAHQEQIKSGKTTIGDLAATESDCSSARKRGDLYALDKQYSEALANTTILGASLDTARCRRSLKKLLLR